MINQIVQKEILACLNSYIEGAINGKSEPIKQVMHEDAQIFGYLEGELFAGPMELLYNYVDDNEGAGDALTWSTSYIDETNGVACTKVTIKNWHGHNFTDYFTLFKINGFWKIMNKVFSHE
jgi:Putative lumazine-binding